VCICVAHFYTCHITFIGCNSKWQQNGIVNIKQGKSQIVYFWIGSRGQCEIDTSHFSSFTFPCPCPGNDNDKNGNYQIKALVGSFLLLKSFMYNVIFTMNLESRIYILDYGRSVFPLSHFIPALAYCFKNKKQRVNKDMGFPSSTSIYARWCLDLLTKACVSSSLTSCGNIVCVFLLQFSRSSPPFIYPFCYVNLLVRRTNEFSMKLNHRKRKKKSNVKRYQFTLA